MFYLLTYLLTCCNCDIKINPDTSYVHAEQSVSIYLFINPSSIHLSDCLQIFIMAARQLCWLPAILFYRCRLDLSFFRRLISEVAWPIVTQLCHMFDGDPDL